MHREILWIGLSLGMMSLSLGACGDKNSNDTGGESGGDESGGDESGGDESGGDESGGDESGGDEGGDEGGGDDGGGTDSGASGDVYAQTACTLLQGTLTSIQAATSEGEASQALLVPSETEAWLVEDGATDRYVMLEVEDWMVTVRVFATDGVGVDLMGIEQTDEQSENEACSGYTDQAFMVHEWGSYVLHLEGEGEVALSVIQEPSEE